MEGKKVLLMGRSASGKTSMRAIIFANYFAKDTTQLGATVNSETSTIRFMGNLSFSLWDCGGQENYMLSYFGEQQNHIFGNVAVLIYVFDLGKCTADNKIPPHDLRDYRTALELLNNKSPNAMVFCLLHKADLIPDGERDEIINRIQTELKQASLPYTITTYSTSIWDETLYKKYISLRIVAFVPEVLFITAPTASVPPQAWSNIVSQLVPTIGRVESALQRFCDICRSDEMVLFESTTFLVIAHVLGKKVEAGNDGDYNFREDKNRFEKISAIIKQFKLSCNKLDTTVSGIAVNEPNRKVIVEQFTSTSYLMVIISDRTIQQGSILANIRKIKPMFEKITASKQ